VENETKKQRMENWEAKKHAPQPGGGGGEPYTRKKKELGVGEKKCFVSILGAGELGRKT